MNQETLLLSLLSKKSKEERVARTAWEGRGPKDNWLVLLDAWKKASCELKEVLDAIEERY